MISSLLAAMMIFNVATMEVSSSENEKMQSFCESFAVEESDASDTDSTITYYGDATPYVSVNDSSINCFGYALGVDSWIKISFFQACTRVDDNMYYDRVIPGVIQDAASYNVTVRQLSGLNDTIYSNERRIAFRVARQNNKFIDFHFMRQHDDGSWSHKLGGYASAQYNTSYNNIPEYEAAWYYTFGSSGSNYVYYNTDTIYFSVR